MNISDENADIYTNHEQSVKFSLAFMKDGCYNIANRTARRQKRRYAAKKGNE